MKTPNTHGGNCYHCGGTASRKGGQVCLDIEPHGYLAPCPMCDQGTIIDRAQYNGEYWISGTAGYTWENGLTGKHNRKCSQPDCFRPAASRWCDHHTTGTHRTSTDYAQIRSNLKAAASGLIG